MEAMITLQALVNLVVVLLVLFFVIIMIEESKGK